MGICPSVRERRAQIGLEIDRLPESAISAESAVSARFTHPNSRRLIDVCLSRSLLEVVLGRRLVDLGRGLIGVHRGRRLIAVVLRRGLVEDLWRLGG
jgi:hypothetical protein